MKNIPFTEAEFARLEGRHQMIKVAVYLLQFPVGKLRQTILDMAVAHRDMTPEMCNEIADKLREVAAMKQGETI